MRRLTRPTHGFTFIELLMVFAILGIVLAFGLPRFTDARRSLAVRSARDNVASYLATARAAAIRRGAPARFVVEGAVIDVHVMTQAGIFVPLTDRAGQSASRRDLGTQYSVAIEPSGANIIEYNSRGFAMLGGTHVFAITRETRRDSVCISGLGLIMRQGCQP